MNPLAVDHHAQIKLPLPKLESSLKGADLGVEQGPLVPGSDGGP